MYSLCFCLLSPRMALDTAKEAAKMYGGKVQIELDFFKLKGVYYQVGHLGVSDMAYRYNLLCFSVCKSENQTNTIRLLETALELIKVAKGEIEFVLIDGGKALRAAVEELNLGQRGKELVEAIIKACFTHNMRYPGTRGGGKRGGNGSFVRYMLDHGVSNLTVSKVNFLIIIRFHMNI